MLQLPLLEFLVISIWPAVPCAVLRKQQSACVQPGDVLLCQRLSADIATDFQTYSGYCVGQQAGLQSHVLCKMQQIKQETKHTRDHS